MKQCYARSKKEYIIVVRDISHFDWVWNLFSWSNLANLKFYWNEILPFQYR